MKKAKSDPAKAGPKAETPAALDARPSEGAVPAPETEAPARPEDKSRRRQEPRRKAAPPADSAAVRFRRLLGEELDAARRRTGRLWGRFRGKKYIRPGKGQIRQLIRRRFTYQELLGVLLALCPLVGVTGTVADGVAAGLLSTLTVLGSVVLLELFRRILPGGMGSLCHMVVVAGFTTGLTLILQAFAPQLVEELGLYLSMTVVSCLLLERQTAPSREQGTLFLLADCIVTGLSFTLLLAAVSLMREFLGAGTLFGFAVLEKGAPLPILAGPFGGFCCLGCVAALAQGLQLKRTDRAAEKGRRAA